MNKEDCKLLYFIIGAFIYVIFTIIYLNISSDSYKISLKALNNKGLKITQKNEFIINDFENNIEVKYELADIEKIGYVPLKYSLKKQGIVMNIDDVVGVAIKVKSGTTYSFALQNDILLNELKYMGLKIEEAYYVDEN